MLYHALESSVHAVGILSTFYLSFLKPIKSILHSLSCVSISFSILGGHDNPKTHISISLSLNFSAILLDHFQFLSEPDLFWPQSEAEELIVEILHTQFVPFTCVRSYQHTFTCACSRHAHELKFGSCLPAHPSFFLERHAYQISALSAPHLYLTFITTFFFSLSTSNIHLIIIHHHASQGFCKS